MQLQGSHPAHSTPLESHVQQHADTQIVRHEVVSVPDHKSPQDICGESYIPHFVPIGCKQAALCLWHIFVLLRCGGKNAVGCQDCTGYDAVLTLREAPSTMASA